MYNIIIQYLELYNVLPQIGDISYIVNQYSTYNPMFI